MLINHEYRFVYLAIPRTGSTSITRTLYNHFENSIKMGHHRMDVPDTCIEYYIFTTVRNPYFRALSHYRHRYRYYKNTIANWSFSKYIKNITKEDMPKYGINNDPPCATYPKKFYKTEFIKLEEIKQQWKSLSIWKNKNFIELPHLNRSINTEGIYTQYLADCVYEYYMKDFNKFGYSRSSWKTTTDFPSTTAQDQ